MRHAVCSHGLVSPTLDRSTTTDRRRPPCKRHNGLFGLDCMTPRPDRRARQESQRDTRRQRRYFKRSCRYPRRKFCRITTTSGRAFCAENGDRRAPGTRDRRRHNNRRKKTQLSCRSTPRPTLDPPPILPSACTFHRFRTRPTARPAHASTYNLA